MSRFATIDEYLRTYPEDVQLVLERVRQTIRKAAPAAEEAIQYQIPTFKLTGRRLVSFAGWKRHISLYQLPAVDAELARDLAPYQAEKSTAKFPLAKPIPYDLIEQLVARRVQQLADNGR